jgi:hypothetical protein
MRLQQFPQAGGTERRERVRGRVEREPERPGMQTIGFDQFDGLAAIQARIVGGIGQEDKRALVKFAALPLPDVIDIADWHHVRQSDAQFLHDFAADGLLGSLARFDSATWWPVENGAVVRVHIFGDKEGAVASEDAEGGLTSFDLHLGYFGCGTISGIT